MKIAIGTDHAAFELKTKIINYLQKKGYEVFDEGTYSTDSCDYPDFAIKVANKVAAGIADRGILICGTGIGMSITANKVKGIFSVLAALCTNEFMAEMTRKHNNSNVLCMGARVSTETEIFAIMNKWLTTEYEAGRHQNRLNKILELEK